MTDLSPEQEALFELATTAGATFTQPQAERWKALKARIEREGYVHAHWLLLNHKHWFEHDPKSMKAFMIVHDAMLAKIEGAP